MNFTSGLRVAFSTAEFTWYGRSWVDPGAPLVLRFGQGQPYVGVDEVHAGIDARLHLVGYH